MVHIKSLSCPNCGAGIPDTSKACGHCGSLVVLSDDRQKFLLAGTICPKCGLDNKEQHRFCSKCGEKLFKKCPECEKEVGLDAMHCPFCGNNIDNAVKEKEMALANRAYSRKQIEQLRSELQPLFVKLQPLQNELVKIQEQTEDCNYATRYGEVWWQFFLIIYPIGALILAVIAHLIGFRQSFQVNVIVSYLIIFAIVYLRPRMRLIDLERRRDSLSNKANPISTEIHRINVEISKHERIMKDVFDKYGVG